MTLKFLITKNRYFQLKKQETDDFDVSNLFEALPTKKSLYSIDKCFNEKLIEYDAAITEQYIIPKELVNEMTLIIGDREVIDSGVIITQEYKIFECENFIEAKLYYELY